MHNAEKPNSPASGRGTGGWGDCRRRSTLEPGTASAQSPHTAHQAGEFMGRTRHELRNGTPRLPARCASPICLTIPSIPCYTLVGWSDDRVELLALPDPVAASPLSYPPNGLQRKLLLLDPESVPRVVSLSLGSSIVGKKLYVGNLTYNVNESDLETMFSQFGTVQSATGHRRPGHKPLEGVRFCRDGHGRPSSGGDPGTPRPRA